ncbi:FtsX-like permease family protein [Heliobacterium undosum]|uniref:FtsX-like permease family protein n=1 Tax=Heliomicrobium undosum TaxID=121734 RepID=A0A845KYY5_9FIRM|nr:FtsX-like permease family protein [Heliomicrobium undosum]MZP28286.1 FtsX-like permease family protein [Heliomicrobium undosum]
MSPLQIIIASLFRRPGKSLPILLGFAVCWATLFSLITLSDGATQAAQRETVQAGNMIQVTTPSASIAFAYAGIPVTSGVAVSDPTLPPDALERMSGTGRLLPKLVTPGRINGKKALIVGANMADEMDVKKGWRFIEETLIPEERPMNGAREQGLFYVGSTAAETLQLRPGSPLRITGEKGVILDGIVGAVFAASGDVEDRLIFTDLDWLQRSLGKEKTLTFVEIQSERDGAEAARLLQERLGPSVAVQADANPGASSSRREMAASLQRFTSLVGVTVLTISSLLLFVTMTGAIEERRSELGLLFALGFRPSHVRRLLIGEGVLLAGTGAVAGALIGYGLAVALAPMVIGAGIPLPFPALPMAGGTCLALLLGALAAFRPASRAAVREPAEAFR